MSRFGRWRIRGGGLDGKESWWAQGSAGGGDLFGSFVGVDALCINQENLKERSHQVQRIGLIYENAFQVIVWFGTIYYEPRTPTDVPSWWEPGPTVPSTLAQGTFSGICKIVNEWRSRAGLLDTLAEATYETTTTGHTSRPSGDIMSAGSPL